MNRINRVEERVKELEQERDKLSKDKKKKFKLLSVLKKLSKKSLNKDDYVLVQYLNLKQQVDFKLCRIVSGDIVIIGNKAHELDPRDVWRHKKDLWYIIREIDRKPVSNRDFDKVYKRNDNTSEDVPLIKAILGAINKNKDKSANKNVVLWIIGGLIAAVFAFTLMGGS